MAAGSAALPRVAIAHDYLTQLGGAERIAARMARLLPEATLFASIHRTREVPLDVAGGRAWRTSSLQKAGHWLNPRALTPMMPAAFRGFDLEGYDIVVSSSSTFAHHIRKAPGAVHIAYVHSPPRFLWHPGYYFEGRAALKRLAVPFISRLRRLDLEAAAGIDIWVANSQNIARQIARVYGREARVVYPAVECDRFPPSPQRSGRFLVVSRLVRTKRIDLVIETANAYGLPVDIIGGGPDLSRLRALAGAGVRFLGRQPDGVVARAMAESIAVIVPGEEDFGMTIAEAQAAGRPPIAFRGGGALEIVEDGVTGYFFGEHTAASLAEAMFRAREDGLDAAALQVSARRFDAGLFDAAFLRLVREAAERADAQRGATSALVATGTRGG